MKREEREERYAGTDRQRTLPSVGERSLESGEGTLWQRLMQLALESGQALSDDGLFSDDPPSAAFQSCSFLLEPDRVLPREPGRTVSGLRYRQSNDDHQHQQQREPMQQHHEATDHQQGDEEAFDGRGGRGKRSPLCGEGALLSLKPLEMGLQVCFLPTQGRTACSHLTSLFVITPILLSLPPRGGSGEQWGGGHPARVCRPRCFVASLLPSFLGHRLSSPLLRLTGTPPWVGASWL